LPALPLGKRLHRIPWLLVLEEIALQQGAQAGGGKGDDCWK
jgi:hypothetical protein